MPVLVEGDLVPDFALPGDDGATVSPASLRGAPYVLWVYPKADTSGCTVEAGDFTRLKPDFDALGVALVGVSADPARKLARFRAKHGLAGALVSDEERTLLEALGVWVEKSMYGRKYMGAERTTLLVDGEGRVARLWPKVSVPGHAEAVLAAAREL
jgi:thioredoxin-dependent peroxiredoxin